MNDKLLSSVLDHIPGFLYLQNRDYSINYANRHFLEHFGDPAGRACFEVYHGNKKPCAECRTFKVFDTGAPQSWEWRSLDDRAYQMYDYPFKSAGGKPQVLKMGIDITDRKKMEEESIKTRKLESIALLAGGVAHDFNNLLTTILGNISLAKMQLKPGNPVGVRLKEAEKAGLRAKDLTYQLYTFARGKDIVRKVASIDYLLQETAEFALSKSDSKCEFDFHSRQCCIEVDEAQISQVIYGLLMNAQEAMPDGGVIRISTGRVTVRPEDAIPLTPGDYVKITIKDNGAGIKNKYLPNIFDPYFTTQKMDSRKGIGLGLAICYSIIKNHDGHISVESAPGSGTSFYIYLPALQKASC